MFGCAACPSSPTFPVFAEVEHHMEEVHGVRGVLRGPATRAVLLPSTLSTYQCLLCVEGGWVEEKQVQVHLSDVHGEFFARRWEEYSTSTCRMCGEGVAKEEVEHHTALHHPRSRFARGDKEPRAEAKVEVDVKGNEDVVKMKLEEVSKLGEVTRVPGETRLKLTQGEADLVLGRDARTVVGLNRISRANISIKGSSEDNEREMVISGKENQVSLVEERVAKILARNTYIKIKLKSREMMSLC